MKPSFLDQPSRLRPDRSKREVLRDMGIGIGTCLAIVALSSLSSDNEPAPSDDKPSVSYLDIISD